MEDVYKYLKKKALKKINRNNLIPISCICISKRSHILCFLITLVIWIALFAILFILIKGC